MFKKQNHTSSLYGRLTLNRPNMHNTTTNTQVNKQRSSERLRRMITEIPVSNQRRSILFKFRQLFYLVLSNQLLKDILKIYYAAMLFTLL